MGPDKEVAKWGGEENKFGILKIDFGHSF